MKIRSTSLLIAISGFLAILGFTFVKTEAEKRPESKKPNVVIILTDDQRWDALSVSGNPYLKTPNIDKLAAEGVFFKNYFCTTSLCSPSRASILSGVYAHTHGVVNNFTDFPSNRPNMAGVLHTAGYETAYIGKWHMGEENDNPRPGFDYFVTHKGQGKYWDTKFNINGQGSKEIKGYYTNVVTKLAKDWLQTKKSKPFFLILGHKAPHSFYTPEPKYAKAFDGIRIPYPESAFELSDKPKWIEQRLTTWHGIYGPLFEWRKNFPDSSPEAVKDFDAMIHAYWGTILSVDDSVGEIYQTLKEREELDNTIFIFTSDNGLLNGEHGMVDKRTMHEPSIHIPLIVRFPGLTPTNKPVVVDKQVLTLDIAPSVLDLCGAPALPDIHGKSFRKLVQGDTKNWRKAWYYEYNYEKQFPYTPNVRGIRTDEWKYIHYPTGDGNPDKHLSELYHLATDPGENHNLIKEPKYAGQLKHLQTELTKLLKQTGAETDKMPLDEGVKSYLPEKSIR